MTPDKKMDPRLEAASNLEKAGDYKAALEAYLRLEAGLTATPATESGPATEPLSDADRLYLRRSIAACYYYLKDYTEAETRFKSILAGKGLKTSVRREVQTCLWLCWLYGGSPKKAKAAFTKRLEGGRTGKSRGAFVGDCFDWWYLGQSCFQLHEYGEMEDAYNSATNAAEWINSDKASFFMSHLVAAMLLNGKLDDAGRVLNHLSFMQDTSCGLAKIVRGLYGKMSGNNAWVAEFEEGVKEAEKNRYVENEELAQFLLKELS